MLGSNTSAIYLAVADGKIVRRTKEPTATSKERITKTGKIVHEEHYDYVMGLIVDIATRENEYGKFWNVVLLDGSEKYTLQFQYSGGNASSFLRALPNVDLSKPVKMIPRVQIDKDKKRSSIVMVQGENAIRWKWTKDNPGDMPTLRKVKVKGIEQWDDSDMMEYLEKYVFTEIKPKLTAGPSFGADLPETEDDAPF